MYDFFNEGITYEELNQFQKNKADWLENTNRYSENTKKSYWTYLNEYINDFEVKKEKDLMHFNKEELINTLNDISSKTYSIFVNTLSVIKSYIKEKEIYKEMEKNYCDEIDFKKILKDKIKVIDFSYRNLEEFYNFILEINCSDIDKMMITLLRYGADIEDIGFIKWEDIDRENKILNIKSLKLPIDNLFLIMLDNAKKCNEYSPGQKKVVYVDYGYILKATPTVRWKNASGAICHNKIGQIERRIKNKISVTELNKSRRYDLLLKKNYENNIVTKSDLIEIVDIFEKDKTESKVENLKKNFELTTGIKVDTKRR